MDQARALAPVPKLGVRYAFKAASPKPTFTALKSMSAPKVSVRLHAYALTCKGVKMPYALS